jgi:hypothetical protein
MRTTLIGFGLILSLTLVASTGAARLRVVKTKAGPAFRLDGKSVPFSALQRGEQRLGPYLLKQNADTGKVEAKRSWTFGKTRAVHTRSYNTSGASYGWNRSTGQLSVPGHRVRTVGRNPENGRYNWKIETKDNPFQILAEGTNSKGPTRYHKSLTGPYGTFSKTVHRDGRVEHGFKAPGPELALPAPKAKSALPAPEAKPALPAPEAKLALPAPKTRLALPAPEKKLALPAPPARQALPAPEARPFLPAPEPRLMLPAPSGQ